MWFWKHILLDSLPLGFTFWVGPFEVGPVVSLFTSIYFSWGGISVSLRRCFFLHFLSESKHCNYSLQLWFFTLLGMEPQEKLLKAIDPTHWKMHIKYQKQFQQYHFSLEAHPRTQVHGQGVRSPCSTKTFFLPAFFILSLVLFSNQV